MKFAHAPQLAGVPQELHASALASLEKAQKASKGTTLAKWKVRLFKTKRIARLLDWEDERLCLKFPELADWDIAPMLNITAHGDHVPWALTPEGGRPVPNVWLNKDPSSVEYQEAVNDPISKRYFKGNHPRSKKAREMWYHRNAGEYKVWRLGEPVNPADGFQSWFYKDKKLQIKVSRCGDAWIVNSLQRLIGKIVLKRRQGYEVDNVFLPSGEQSWYPIAGHELRAPVSWSTLPGFN